MYTDTIWSNFDNGWDHGWILSSTINRIGFKSSFCLKIFLFFIAKMIISSIVSTSYCVRLFLLSLRAVTCWWCLLWFNSAHPLEWLEIWVLANEFYVSSYQIAKINKVTCVQKTCNFFLLLFVGWSHWNRMCEIIPGTIQPLIF